MHCSRLAGKTLVSIGYKKKLLNKYNSERCEGATIYCSACPCLSCAKKIVQAGVMHVLYSEKYGMDELSQALFHEAGVSLRKVPIKSSYFYGLSFMGDHDDIANGEDSSATSRTGSVPASELLLNTSMIHDDVEQQLQDLDSSFTQVDC